MVRHFSGLVRGSAKIGAGLGLVFGLALAPTASSNVSLKNGNFFVAYRDLYYPGGFEPKVERVYNSKTGFQGIFGYGWGTEYEVYLTVSADGSVVVNEYGGGAQNRFTPVGFNKAELATAVDSLTETAKKQGMVTAKAQIDAFKKKLSTDAIFRNETWEGFVAKGLLKARTVKDGTQFTSNRFSYQFLTKVAGGYVRSFDNGRVERFNEAGRLGKVTDKNNNFIVFTYGKDNHLNKIEDNFSRKIYFTFNSQGLVESVEGLNGKKAVYKYNKQNELVYCKDTDANVYTYEYSTDQWHNLTKIGYADNSSMNVEYFGKDLNQNVKSLKDRDGTLTEYSYKYKDSDRNHFTVGVDVKTKGGKVVSRSTYEYVMKVKDTGELYNYSLATTIDGDRTETIFNECCGMPIMIKRGKEVTAFKYDTKGHVTEKSGPTEVKRLAYDKSCGKVTHVQLYSKLTQKKKWSSFKYDPKCNLVTAKDSDARFVQLFYDTQGRIARMRDKSNRVLKFEYNENSKPIKITDPQLGAINVAYTNSGEIKNVDSTAGRKIAMQVTTAFQTLLDIIRPAGVNLSF